MNPILFTVPLLLSLPLAASLSENNTLAHSSEVSPVKNIVDTAVTAGQFDTLVAALGAGSLDEALQGDGPFTVFAPTDAAFKALPAGTLDALLLPENKALLQSILKYHVVSGKMNAEQVTSSAWLTSLQGQRIDIETTGNSVTAAGADVIKANVKCSNGVIHVIDKVILPTTDDLVAVAVADGNFGTLAAALKAASLVETLRGDGPFTVFAPTDEAFAKLPAGTVKSLLQPENREQLQAVLTYHVVPGRVMLNQALAGGSAQMLQGGSLPVDYRDGSAWIGSSKIVQADIEASNGVIHVIDSVLIP